MAEKCDRQQERDHSRFSIQHSGEMRHSARERPQQIQHTALRRNATFSKRETTADSAYSTQEKCDIHQERDHSRFSIQHSGEMRHSARERPQQIQHTAIRFIWLGRQTSSTLTMDSRTHITRRGSPRKHTFTQIKSLLWTAKLATHVFLGPLKHSLLHQENHEAQNKK